MLLVCPRDNNIEALGTVPVSDLVLGAWRRRLLPVSIDLGLLAYATLNKHSAPSFPPT